MEGHDYMVARMLLDCGSELWFVERGKEGSQSFYCLNYEMVVVVVVLQKYSMVWWEEKLSTHPT